MPRVCTVCSSPRRDEIDEALTRGEPNRRIAARCGVSETSLRRHAAEHLPRALVLAKSAEEETRADDLLGLLREGVNDARRLRDKAEMQDDVRGAIACVKTLTEIVERLHRVAEQRKVDAKDILTTPAWVAIRETILDALTPVPGAMEALGRALEALAAADRGERPGEVPPAA